MDFFKRAGELSIFAKGTPTHAWGVGLTTP